MRPIDKILDGLTQNQRDAVTAGRSSVSVVYAGPGSGKTRVICHRVAHLVRHGLSASNIILVTFTNKAAIEMKSRIAQLLDAHDAHALTMGTFHSVCSKLLREHLKTFGHQSAFHSEDQAAGLPLLKHTYSIMSTQQCKTCIKTCLTELSLLSGRKKRSQPEGDDQEDAAMEEDDDDPSSTSQDVFSYSPDDMASHISYLKSQEISLSNYRRVDQLIAEYQPGRPPFFRKSDEYQHRHLEDLHRVYRLYEKKKREQNVVDFDDLVLYGVRLLSVVPDIVRFIDHVFVDEFQDTSLLQIKLSMLLSQHRNAITVVGDPNQSIYSWRQAHSTGMNLFESHFRDRHLPVHVYHLTQNFRSSGAIVECSRRLLGRKSRSNTTTNETEALQSHTQNDFGLPVAIHEWNDGRSEAMYVAARIHTLINASQGRLQYAHMAVLVRAGFQMRDIEEALMRWKIPYKTVGTREFFERAEIQDCMAYLKLIHNPADRFAFQRVINVPARGIGDASLKKIFEAADACQLNPIQVLGVLTNDKGIAGSMPMTVKMAVHRILPKTLTKKVDTFLRLVLWASSMSWASLRTLLETLMERLAYERYLETKYPTDWQERWENVQEFMNHASLYESDTEAGLSFVDKLTGFVESLALVADAIARKKEDAIEAGVTISTLHGAKGLEWPCVFIVGCQEDILPLYRSLLQPESIDEERRLLYVGMTRAQLCLSLSYAQNRSMPMKSSDPNGRGGGRLSRFVTHSGICDGELLMGCQSVRIAQIFRHGVHESMQHMQDPLWLEEDRRRWQKHFEKNMPTPSGFEPASFQPLPMHPEWSRSYEQWRQRLKLEEDAEGDAVDNEGLVDDDVDSLMDHEDMYVLEDERHHCLSALASIDREQQQRLKVQRTEKGRGATLYASKSFHASVGDRNSVYRGSTGMGSARRSTGKTTTTTMSSFPGLMSARSLSMMNVREIPSQGMK